MKTKNFFLVAISLLLTGCTTGSKVIITNSDGDLQTAEAKLTATADSISKSLRELAEIDRAIHPQVKLPNPINLGETGIGQLVSIDWNGPVGSLVKKISEVANYKFKVLGTSPAIPILRSISAKDTPLSDVLRDVGFQCGKKANIVLYQKSKVIELRYVKH